MPTYDYECDACRHKFELFQSMTASPVKKCPQCGKLKVRRLIGAGAGIIFKGSGFYCTDYRDKTYSAAAKKDSAAPADSSTSSAPASDAAPAKKADKPATSAGKTS